ncbi:MAG: ATP-dependent DNA helicase RecG [Chloroflexota bacterium]|nr:ATP-dependent DNA helicase RecG [Chloroflexota bacterium]
MTALHHILQLEQSRGHDDKAVAGGLDKFLVYWHTPINEFLSANPELPHPLHPDYSAFSTEQRIIWTSDWLETLEHASFTENPSPLDTSSSPTPSISSVTPKQREDVSDARAAQVNHLRGERTYGLGLDIPIDRLRGISSKLSSKFAKLDVTSIRDLLYHFPRRYNDFSRTYKISDLQPEQEVTVQGVIWEARQTSMGKGGRLKSTEAVISDESGNLKVIWFGQGYLAKTLKTNAGISLSGRVSIYRGQLVLQSPDYDMLSDVEPTLHTGRTVPVYSLTEGVTARNLRRIMWQSLTEWLGALEDPLPNSILDRINLTDLQTAILNVHFPSNEIARDASRRRLAFDELFILQTAVLLRKTSMNQSEKGIVISPKTDLMKSFVSSLSFPLTEAQERCINEIVSDMSSRSTPMNRLIQGEVGSGKTIVVLAGLLAAISDGYQGTLMVPTEVLAEQHFQTISTIFSQVDSQELSENIIRVSIGDTEHQIVVALLTGTTKAKDKRMILTQLQSCEIDLLIGTHAIIESNVEIPNMALAVMDEQHRFGVRQRSALRQKGSDNPHTLVMSATPIPRTLSLTFYGDLDISTLDSLPPGRQTIKTRWIGPDRREVAYGFISKQIHSGRQAFIIYPLIEESESIEAKAATDDYKILASDVFPNHNVGLLHGRMSSREKDKVMRAFRDQELDILISTAVVEVGIDIPNATVMMIEGADRFGLSQLHQFRGRVGRGAHQSYCILVSDDPSEVGKERLSAIETIDDGFKLAEVDLELRGPGDFFGTRQSGLPDLRMARLSDRELLEVAREEASRLLEEDPKLSNPEHQGILSRVNAFLSKVSEEAT